MKKFTNRFSILLFLLFSLSCKDSKVNIPPDILPSEQLVPILADIQIAQASQIILEYTDTVHYTLKTYQLAILNKKNIPEEKFISTMKFYAQYPELLQEINNEVVNELSKRQGELEKK